MKPIKMIYNNSLTNKDTTVQVYSIQQLVYNDTTDVYAVCWVEKNKNWLIIPLWELRPCEKTTLKESN